MEVDQNGCILTGMDCTSYFQLQISCSALQLCLSAVITSQRAAWDCRGLVTRCAAAAAIGAAGPRRRRAVKRQAGQCARLVPLFPCVDQVPAYETRKPHVGKSNRALACAAAAAGRWPEAGTSKASSKARAQGWPPAGRSKRLPAGWQQDGYQNKGQDQPLTSSASRSCCAPTEAGARCHLAASLHPPWPAGQAGEQEEPSSTAERKTLTVGV